MALALASVAAGHTVIAVHGRDARAVREAADRLRAEPLGLDDPVPDCDLVVVAVRDDAVAAVAGSLTLPPTAPPIVHLSGVLPAEALAGSGSQVIGSFHPLQTLPDADRGATALSGAFVGVTSSEDALTELLETWAESLGMRPFHLAAESKAAYHAAAAAAANAVVTSLDVAHRAMAVAGVDPEVLRPLVERVVANVFETSPSAALTGPVARGDVETVASQVTSLTSADPKLGAAFVDLMRATAKIADRSDQFSEVLPCE